MNQREIAKLAGVSTATVSRVVNGDVSVAETTNVFRYYALNKKFYQRGCGKIKKEW